MYLINEYVITAAAGHGQLEILQHFSGYIKSNHSISPYHAAAKGGHLNCLKFLCDISNNSGYATNISAEYNQLNCLEYLLNSGQQLSTKKLAVGGLECLEYLWNRRWITNSAHIAAKGKLECLKFLHENGCGWYSLSLENAALSGNLENLKYLVEQNGITQFKRNTQICDRAAEGGNFECLKFLLESEFEMNVHSCMAAAARGGEVEILKFLNQQQGIIMGQDISVVAAKLGHLNCLKYIFENGGEWNRETYQQAAVNGHLNCVKFLHENGCPWPDAQ